MLLSYFFILSWFCFNFSFALHMWFPWINGLYPYRDNVFVPCSAYRTPLCKAKRGGFKDTYPDDLLAPVLKVRYTKLSHLLMLIKINEDIYL